MSSLPSVQPSYTQLRVYMDKHKFQIKYEKNVDKYTELMPDEDINAIISLYENCNSTASKEEVACMIEILENSFRKIEVNNPWIFYTNMFDVLSKYPSSVGAEAIKGLIRKSKHHPSIAEVNAEAENLVNEARLAAIVANYHKKEREARIERKKELDAIKEDKKNNPIKWTDILNETTKRLKV